ncbi:N-acetylglucosamine-6-phosphate deacetylase [Filibacter tadaridae]|uniref:N-acetylglucosamine-6-phosphate deacetylase n=1 Tax=Filibacter tadaridae TaxID=2483811 RepID=A0A3P5XC34_9BACL|nr:N-acetylglucosamine-6-phosphate deacetylase [Filibacter tadaridae]VDC25054.1 N-acetylglucosamine-6-phosphate deacetylase [Filibacter tadaridae]
MGNVYLLNATIALKDSILQEGFIHIKEEKIESIGKMENCPSLTAADRVFDCSEKGYVIPGMIDIHVHGAAGFDFMDGKQEAFEGIARALAKEGTTSFLATTITNPVSHTSDTLKSLGWYKEDSNGPGVAEMIGIHLEGPFINKEQKGAQPESAIIVPNADLFKEWQELSGNTIKVITYAPELDTDFELLTELERTNVIPSMGHTNATYDESIHAIQQGVTHATHLFNGMKGMHHRDPGVVGAVLLQDDVHVEIIPDGIHFHPDLLKLIVKMKGLERILAITDGMRAKGLPDGEYDLGGQQVTSLDGKCTLTSTGSLAGSIVTMNDVRLNLAKWLELSIHDQVQITSMNQANRLGLSNRKGSLESGKDADIVVIGRDGEIELTICRGAVGYERSGAFG